LTEYPESLNSLFINELICELGKEELNIPMIVKLFKQMLDDLAREVTALFLMDIDIFCSRLTMDDRFNKLPDKLKDIISDCQTLHDYPSKYCISPPEELSQRAKELYEEMGIEEMNIVTKADKILQFYKQEKTVKEIVDTLNIDEHFVVVILTRLGYGIKPQP
jgi:hypothetical protein